MQLQEVEAIAHFLGKTNGEVLTNLGMRLDVGGVAAPVAGETIPVVGRIKSDGTAEIDLEHPSRVIDAPGIVPAGTVAIAANDAGHTASTLIAGGLFFVQITDRLDPAAVGRLSLVRLPSGPWLLRTVKPSIEVGRYDLIGPAGTMEGQTLIAGAPILLIRP